MVANLDRHHAREERPAGSGHAPGRRRGVSGGGGVAGSCRPAGRKTVSSSVTSWSVWTAVARAALAGSLSAELSWLLIAQAASTRPSFQTASQRGRRRSDRECQDACYGGRRRSASTIRCPSVRSSVRPVRCPAVCPVTSVSFRVSPAVAWGSRRCGGQSSRRERVEFHVVCRAPGGSVNGSSRIDEATLRRSSVGQQEVLVADWPVVLGRRATAALDR
jgi:hypothetical protein